jgi:hypothetical protein
MAVKVTTPVRLVCSAAFLFGQGAGAALAQDLPAGSEQAGDAPSGAATSVSGFLYGAVAARRLEWRLNSENGAKVPTLSGAAAGIVDIGHGTFSARVRISREHKRIPGATERWVSEDQLELTQLSLKMPVSEQTDLTLGRLNIGLDDGQSFHPLDFLEDAIRSSDFEDRSGSQRGFPLLMMSGGGSALAYRLVYSDDTLYKVDSVPPYGAQNPGFNRHLKQWLASARWSVEQATATVVYQRPIGGHGGAGASFSYVATAALSLHGALFTARGNALPLHRNAVVGRGSHFGRDDVYIPETPVKAWRADDGRRYTRWLAGASYTTESGATHVVELWRDGRGMSRAEQDIFDNVVQFHRGLADANARRFNLAYDAEAYRSPHGTHAFFRTAMPMPNEASLQPSVLISTRDASGTANARWTQRLTPNWEYGIEAWLRFGKPYSQYGSVADKAGIQASVRWFY